MTQTFAITFVENQPGTQIMTKDFELGVSTGEVSGSSVVDKFGANFLIETTTDPEDIWEFGGVYPFDAFGVTNGLYISSSSANDVGKTLEVQGLDINGDLTVQEVTLTGQSNVTLPTPLWRTFRMLNTSDAGNDFEGVIYCHDDPTPTNGVPASVSVRAIIDGNNNQTLMAVYTIPKGKVGFLYRGELGVELEGNTAALAEYARSHYESRRFGKVFTVKKSITLMVGGGSALYQDPRSFPDVIPSLTDIRLRVVEVSQTMGVWGAFDILLVDESEFSVEYLQAIGQPGY
jgi:hypothetical protein